MRFKTLISAELGDTPIYICPTCVKTAKTHTQTGICGEEPKPVSGMAHEEDLYIKQFPFRYKKTS